MARAGALERRQATSRPRPLLSVPPGGQRASWTPPGGAVAGEIVHGRRPRARGQCPVHAGIWLLARALPFLADMAMLANGKHQGDRPCSAVPSGASSLRSALWELRL